MSDRDALLAAVLAHPDEDTPRLAYADWLDETGEDPERAEFIRSQIGLPAMIDAGDPQWPEVRARVRHLRRANESRWVGAVAPFLVDYPGSFDRGFLTLIEAREHVSTRWLDLLGVALAEHPIETVRVEDHSHFGIGRAGVLKALAGWPQAWKVREFHFGGREQNSPDVLAQLVEIPHLRFTRLGLGKRVDAADLRALTPLGGRLTDLRITTSDSSRKWCAALGGLLAATAVGRLRVSMIDFAANGLAHILDAASGSRVSDLEFWFSGLRVDLTAFARWPHVGRLTALKLDYHGCTPEQFTRLFAEADFRSLTKFQNAPRSRDYPETYKTLGHSGEAWAALLASPCAERLTDLDLCEWDLAGADFGPLARGALPNLRHLNLDKTSCGDAAAEAIAGAAFAPQLRTLGLGNCGITDRGAERLLAADFPRLGELRLDRSVLGDDVRSRLQKRFGDRVNVW